MRKVYEFIIINLSLLPHSIQWRNQQTSKSKEVKTKSNLRRVKIETILLPNLQPKTETK